MISSQLGRIVLGGSHAMSDQMSATPDENGEYGAMGGLLDEVAGRVREREEISSERRPEGLSDI